MLEEDDDGFLAESLEYVREEVRKKYLDWHTLLRQVNRLAVSNQHAIPIHLDNIVERFAAVLFARTVASTQAGILLLEKGLLSQAQTLLRAAMETYFALAAIAKDTSVVNRLIDGHKEEQRSVAKTYGLLKDSELKQSADAMVASGKLEPYLESEETGLSTFDLADKAGLADWYRTVYKVFSWSAHGALEDLAHHLVFDESGNVVGFRNEPEVDNQQISWLCAIEILLKAMAALAEIFPTVEKEPLEIQFAKLCTLNATSTLEDID